MPSRTSGSRTRSSIPTKSAPIEHGQGGKQRRARGRPAVLGRLGHRVDEQQHRRGDAERSGEVVVPAAGGARRIRRDHARRDREDGGRDRDRQEEAPAPAEGREQAAEHEPEREPARAGCRIDPERLVPRRPLGEGGGDDRQPGRRGERSRDALDEPGRDQDRPVRREPAEQRGEQEHGDRDHEHALAPEQVGGPAAEKQEPAVAEDVAADDPLQARGGEVELVVDARKRHPDHRDVEAVEEEGAAEDEQCRPAAPAERRHRCVWK